MGRALVVLLAGVAVVASGCRGGEGDASTTATTAASSVAPTRAGGQMGAPSTEPPKPVAERPVLLVRAGNLVAQPLTGGAATQLTRDGQPSGFPQYHEPVWSRDGTRIAAVKVTAEGKAHLVVLTAAGALDHALTSSSGYDKSPSWSPDGQTVAFASNRLSQAGATDDLFTVDVAGEGLRVVSRLTTASAPDRNSRHPTWSVDGTRLLFECWTGKGVDICAIPRAGGTPQNLLAEHARAYRPSVSPDGSSVVYESDVGNTDQRWDIWVADATTLQGRRRVATHAPGGTLVAAAWTFDGRVVHMESSAGPSLVKVVDLSTRESKPLGEPGDAEPNG